MKKWIFGVVALASLAIPREALATSVSTTEDKDAKPTMTMQVLQPLKMVVWHNMYLGKMLIGELNNADDDGAEAKIEVYVPPRDEIAPGQESIVFGCDAAVTLNMVGSNADTTDPIEAALYWAPVHEYKGWFDFLDPYDQEVFAEVNAQYGGVPGTGAADGNFVLTLADERFFTVQGVMTDSTQIPGAYEGTFNVYAKYDYPIYK